MAEVYGDKPKMFSREWWPYFWMYYKWHTVIAAVVIFGLVITVTQKARQVEYDMNLTYMAQALYIGENGERELMDALEPFVKDINGDGEGHIFLNQINISGDERQAELDVNMRTKHDLEFSDPNSYIYIYDKTEFDMVIKNAGPVEIKDLYLPVSEWAEIPKGAVVRVSDDGVAYGVCLKDSKIMADCGIDSDELFVYIKNDVLFDEKNETVLANAKAIANELIK